MENRPGPQDGSPSTIAPVESAYDRVIAALELAGLKVRHSGGSTTAQCPAHDDNNPSLSIRDGDGRVLVNCHAGCETRDVVHALGLTMSDLFDEVYEYDDGRKVHRQYDKDGRKKFHQSGNRNGTACLYRLKEVRKKIAEGGRVFVVEGEKDVHTLETLGSVATCSPMGAGNADKCDWTPLKGARIALIADKDEAGREYAIRVRDILTDLDCQVDVFEARTGKDISDHIAAGHTIDETVRIELPETGDERPYVALDWHALWSGEDHEEWIVEPLIAAGRATAIYSAPKVGKSLLMLEAAAAIAAGRPVLGVVPERRRVLYVDHENDPKHDVIARLKDMGYEPGDLDDLRYYSFPSMAKLDSQQGGRELFALAESAEAELVVVDTISRAVGGKENENDTWLDFYRHTGLLFKRAGIAVVRLDHSGKDASKGTRGGSAKAGDVDATWLLSRKSGDMLTLSLDDARMRIPASDRSLTLHRVAVPHLRHTVEGKDSDPFAPDPVQDVVRWLVRLGIPADSGWKPSAQALRTDGWRGSDDVVKAATKVRQAGLALQTRAPCKARVSTSNPLQTRPDGDLPENAGQAAISTGSESVDPVRPEEYRSSGLDSPSLRRGQPDPGSSQEEKTAPFNAMDALLDGDA